MLDAAKCADLVLLLVDGSFGFEMETFEFLNLLQVGAASLSFAVGAAAAPFWRAWRSWCLWFWWGGGLQCRSTAQVSSTLN